MEDDQGAVGHAATLDGIAGDLEAVDAALARLDDGTFGCCTYCGGEIAADELARDPLITVCAEHAHVGAAQGVRSGAEPSERAVGVFARDDPLAFGREHPEG